MLDRLPGAGMVVAAAAGHDSGTGALTVALALLAGLFCQALAHHLRIPGIVLLLAAGVLLGPDALGVVRPDLLDGAVQALVGFAVAVILFEGGMNLQLGRLRRETASIRGLVTVGAVVTAVGATFAALWILHWDWRLAILFGTLMIVTGPTVITPLIRRIRLTPNLHTVLEAEGVLIDPIGAIIAVVALEVVIQPSGTSLAAGILGVGTRLGFGAALGFAGGFAVAFLVRQRWLIPDSLRNVFTLSWVLALFHVSNAILPESGIATVTAAGLAVGNVRSEVLGGLIEFKEQLTVMLIGLLFVLLSADVRFEEVAALGLPGLLTVAALVFLVRPLNVLAGTARSKLGWREKTFIAWMAPRGIVAAAVASLFALSLDAAEIPGGAELRAMVFLVIAITVPLYGLTGGPLARLLGVRRTTDRGTVILGANDLGRALGRALRDGGEDVTFIDSNPDAVHLAEQEGFRVVFGNAFEERSLLQARLDASAAAVAVTPNEEVNLLFVRQVRDSFKLRFLYAALHLGEGHVTESLIHQAGAHVLFGVQRDLDLWSVRIQRKLAVTERYRLAGAKQAALYAQPPHVSEEERSLLPLAHVRRGVVSPVSDRTVPAAGDVVSFLVFVEGRGNAERWLREWGWEREADEPGVPD